MENPRPERVSTVAEIASLFRDADAAILTEYRGLTVAQLADIRRQLRAAGGKLKVFKNTLARIAADRKSTRLNSSHVSESRMPSSA